MKESILAIILAIIGVAVIALILSNQSNTTSVISSGSGGFINALKCALSPVTGGRCAGSSRSLIPNVTSTISY